MKRKMLFYSGLFFGFLALVYSVLEFGFKIPIFYKPKIYDCFMVFNELDLLEVHLAELYDQVDKFVIVECIECQNGKLKPLYFQENKQRYQKYLDKIIHIVVEERPYLGVEDPWHREFFQRNQILRGLKKCHPKDIVIITDLDEILRGDKIQAMVKRLKKNKDPVLVPILDFHRWFYNFKEKEPMTATILTTYKHVRKHKPQKVRMRRFGHMTFPDGGWHFSNMGGWKTFMEKLHSFSHWRECLADKDNLDPQKTYERIKADLEVVEIDETFPKYIRDHLDEFIQKGYIDTGKGFLQ